MSECFDKKYEVKLIITGADGRIVHIMELHTNYKSDIIKWLEGK